MKSKLQKMVAKLLFPAIKKDWYLERGYMGNNPKDVFANYVAAQKKDEERWPRDSKTGKNEWDDIAAQRKFVRSADTKGQEHLIDMVSFKPSDSLGKPGDGVNILNFFGRGEFYECNFRDMLKEAHATGATIHAFNPSGLNSSTGKAMEFNDIVNDGIAAVRDLLKRGVHPDKIVFQGNCLGGQFKRL